jgi:ferredoxin
MAGDDSIYRLLQQHLDRQAVGFPSVKSGADIRLLRRLFTPEEAKLALHLTYKPSPTEAVAASAGAEWAAGEVAALLESMLQKGAIGWKRRDGADHWYVMPLVVGMYECQDGEPSPEFLQDSDAYMRTLAFGKSFLAVKPSQMRTIPVNRSIPVEHPVATYDQTRELLREARGPFVVLPCICRRSQAMRGKPCAKVTREETCLGFGDMAAMVLRRSHGREVTREEALAVLEANQEDGLVLQPANARRPEFICSCCGCCCGMLSIQKRLPHPSDFWSSSYFAEVSAEACAQCGTCVSRCQVNAVTLSGPAGEAVVNRDRCIGCGLCVTTCPGEALRLVRKEGEPAPPADEEALCDEIMANKKGTLGQLQMLAKVALGRKQ